MFGRFAVGVLMLGALLLKQQHVSTCTLRLHVYCTEEADACLDTPQHITQSPGITCATETMPSRVLALISSRMAVSFGVKAMPCGSKATDTWNKALVLSVCSTCKHVTQA